MTFNANAGRFNSSRWAARAVGLVAGSVYLIQAWVYAHTQESILDEGAYLYKGYLFVSGRYWPYQDYGVWTNHMPLSFLIPGAIQVLFGPGLRTARCFAILLSVLTLAGLWVLVNRLAGRWWAAAAIGAMALNPAMIKTYSMGLSQGLVACMLVWIAVLVLDERRSSLRIVLGALLAGLTVMTREEMVVILPILVLFTSWRHGLRMGALAALAGGLPVAILYALYWPGIWRLSGTIAPFLSAWQSTNIGTGVWDNSLPFSDRWQSFLLGLRANFIPLVGVIGLSPLWLRADQWRTRFYRQAAAFLSVLFIVLMVLHGWAALGMNYCVFCFEGYLTFTAPLGLALVAVTYAGWKAADMRWYFGYTSVLMILLFTSVGYSAQQEIGPILLGFPFPRLKEGRILGGTAPVSVILENAFGIEYKLSRWLISTFSGLILSIVLLLIIWLIYRSRRAGVKLDSYKGLSIMTAMLVTGALLSPTVVLAGAKQDRDCSGDVIASYESVGKHLAEVIPSGGSVYWAGGLSVVPLLYLPGIEIYPAQINDGYSYRLGGDTDEVKRIGLWNEELKNKWLQEADFILIEKLSYNSDWKEFLETGQFEELAQTPSYLPCRDNPLRVFRRIKP
jgi:hypothetical protein